MVIESVQKRSGDIVPFDKEKITTAIFKAAQSVGGNDKKQAQLITENVVSIVEQRFPTSVPHVEEIQDIIEKVLIETGHAKTAKAFILYRAERQKVRLQKDPELEAMFAHKSKLYSLVPHTQVDAYKQLFLLLRQLQNEQKVPIRQKNDYLAANELAENIYKNKYYLKNMKGDAIESRPEQVFSRIAAFMAAVETTAEKQQYWAKRFYNILYNGYFVPGGRVIAGAGDLYRIKSLSNCFVSTIQKDNIESIYQTAYECARTYSYGGGIGVDLSCLRPRDSIVHNAADKSTGAVSFMDLYSLTTGLIGQSGRRGALMLTLDVKHPDIFHFVSVKKNPNWITKQIVEQCRWSNMFDEKQLTEIERQVKENTQIRFANISMKVSDEFMLAVHEQTTYGKNTILIYKKKNNGRILSAPQVESRNYSYGIPSKNIQEYELIKNAETLEEINAFLTKQGVSSISKELLQDATLRDIYGDLVTSGKDSEYAIKYAGDFMLYFGSDQTGELRHLIKARELWDMFVAGNYETAEPGLIFWTAMSKYSPSNYVGRPIASTNPCVAADTLISTENGLERIDSIEAENIVVDKRTYSSNSNQIAVQYGCETVKPAKRILTGYKDCYKIETKAGYEVIATRDHKILTTTGWKEVENITEEDALLIQSGAGCFNKDSKLPFEVKNTLVGKNKRVSSLNLPTTWSRELGLLLGWLVGDGYYNEKYHKVGFVFAKGDEEARKIIQPIFEKYCNRKIKLTQYPNGCVQVRSSSKYIVDFLKKLGLKQAGQEREVPAALFTATEDAVVGFLEGLFSSDGTIGLGSKSRNYVRLNSSSMKLLKQVQVLLLNMGVKSTIYDRSTVSKVFRYVNKNNEVIKYKTSGINYELNISKENVVQFINKVLFVQTKHKEKVAVLNEFEFYKETFTDKIKLKEFVGKREVWDITEPVTHSFIANGIIVHNCGEVPLEDGGACNLSSINLSRFVENGYMPDATIKWDEMKAVTKDCIRFLDNIITWNTCLNPLEKQRKAATITRRIGLGVIGIADMLNQLGIGYDSDEGIDMLERVSKFVADAAYEASAELAEEKGCFPAFDYDAYAECPFFKEAISLEVQQMVKEKGLRNVALLSIAPTGTISNIVLGYVGKEGKHYIGVSGGIEPIFSLYYTRRAESFGNKLFKVFHSTIQAYIDMNSLQEKVQEARSLDDMRKILPAHFFRTAHFISPENRVRMQGIVQKYIDHSISSTVNLPESIDPETISDIYLDAWKKGLKGITIYRDGSRYAILSIDKQQSLFQEQKYKLFKVIVEGKEMFLKGHEVFTLPDGRLSTPFHAMQRTIPGVIVAFAEKASEEKSTDEKKDIKKNVCEVKVEGGKIVRTCSE
jgi:ribonucleotide reductase alpha subunit